MLRSLRSLVASTATSFTSAATPAAASAAPSAMARAAVAASTARALTTLPTISSAAASTSFSVSAAVPSAASLSSLHRSSASFLHPRHRRCFSTIESLATGPLPASGPADDPHARFVVLYTCKVCETRAAKSVSRQAYTAGVVLLRCDGCNKHHLFADHLGWFEDEGTDIESILAAKGVSVGRSSLNLKPEEIKQLEALQRQMQEQARINMQRKREAEEKAAAAGSQADDDAATLKADAHAPEAVVEPPVPKLK